MGNQAGGRGRGGGEWADAERYMPDVGDQLDVRVGGAWRRGSVEGWVSETVMRVQYYTSSGRIKASDVDVVKRAAELAPAGTWSGADAVAPAIEGHARGRGAPGGGSAGGGGRSRSGRDARGVPVGAGSSQSVASARSGRSVASGGSDRTDRTAPADTATGRRRFMPRLTFPSLRRKSKSEEAPAAAVVEPVGAVVTGGGDSVTDAGAPVDGEIVSVYGNDTLYTVGDAIDIKDIFPHQSSPSVMMYHWRAAEILAVRPPSRIKIGFAGWPSEYDLWLDVTADRERLAPFATQSGPHATSHQLDASSERRRLSEAGHALLVSHTSDSATTPTAVASPGPLSATRQLEGHFSKGDYVDVNFAGRWHGCEVLAVQRDDRGGVAALEVVDEVAHRPTWVPIASGRIAPFGSESTKKHHSFTVGMFVDVKDFFHHKDTGQLMFKWRGCEIQEVRSSSVYVHYLGWSHYYDEWIDVIETPGRVRALGEMTVGETEEERAKKESEAMFRAAMESQGLAIHDMDADGNCLFRSVAHQIYGDAELHSKVREDTCKYMEDNRKAYENAVGYDFDEYLVRMRLDKEWGGHPEQLALEEMFDRPMEIYSREEFAANNTITPMKLDFDGGLPESSLRGVAPIRLSYHGGNHFNSVEGKADELPLGPRDTSVIRASRRFRDRTLSGGRKGSFMISHDERKEAPLDRKGSDLFAVDSTRGGKMSEDGAVPVLAIAGEVVPEYEAVGDVPAVGPGSPPRTSFGAPPTPPPAARSVSSGSAARAAARAASERRSREGSIGGRRGLDESS